MDQHKQLQQFPLGPRNGLTYTLSMPPLPLVSDKSLKMVAPPSDSVKSVIYTSNVAVRCPPTSGEDSVGARASRCQVNFSLRRYLLRSNKISDTNVGKTCHSNENRHSARN